MDPDDPARNKANSLVLNMTHLGSNVKRWQIRYPKDHWSVAELTSSAEVKRRGLRAKGEYRHPELEWQHFFERHCESPETKRMESLFNVQVSEH